MKNPDHTKATPQGLPAESPQDHSRERPGPDPCLRAEIRKRTLDLEERRVALTRKHQDLQARLRELRRRWSTFPRPAHLGSDGEAPAAPDWLENLRCQVEEIRRRTRALHEEARQQRRRYRHRQPAPSSFDRPSFDRLPDAVLVTDEFGTIHEANEAAAGLFGRQTRALRGKPFAMLIDLEDRRRLRTLIFDAIRNPEGRLHQIRLLAGKRAVPIQVRIAADRSRENEGYQLVWALRDVSEIVATEARLDESESRLRSIFDSATEAIAVNVAEDETYLDVNPEFERLFGFSREEVIGRTDDDLGLWADPAEHRTIVARLRQEGAVRNLPGRLRRKDGGELNVLLSATTIRVEGRPATVSFVRDVTAEHRAETERRDLEARIRDRSRMAELGSLVARVVHDLRNPLVAISLNAGAMVRELEKESPAPLGEYADDILTAARRLDQMLSSISAFTRRKQPRLSETDAAELARRVQTLLAPVARERRIDLSTNAEGPRRLQADEPQLLRVLENLVKNALDAIGEGPGTVRIEVSVPATGQLRITVRDDGPGIPEGFDPFALFATTKPEGTGLGLAIAREIAEAHGGTLTFGRLEPHGAAFSLDLPVDAEGHPDPTRLPDPGDRH